MVIAIPHLQSLAEGVHVWLGGGGDSNAGCIETGDGLIVIDAQQHRGAARHFRDEIEKNLALPIRVLINTHYHLDHISGNVVFNEVPIIAHEQTLARLEGALGKPDKNGWTITDTATKIEMFFGSNIRQLISRDDPAWQWFKERVATPEYDVVVIRPPSETFSERFTFHLSGEIVTLAYWGPAHCVGDIPVILQKARIAFLGDLLFCGRFPWLGDCDLDGWIAALDRVLRLDLEIVVPGHGPPVTLAEVQAFRNLLGTMRNEVQKAVVSGMSEEAAVFEIGLPEFSGMPRYDEWIGFNVRSVYRHLKGLCASKCAPAPADSDS